MAYDRLGSAWAASLVLLADILPGMVLGPVVGAWLDRRDRRRSAALADGLRAAALAGMIFVPGAAPMLALAVVAGLGNTIFRPAVFGLLPDVAVKVSSETQDEPHHVVGDDIREQPPHVGQRAGVLDQFGEYIVLQAGRGGLDPFQLFGGL